VVGYDAHGDVGFFIFTVSYTAKVADFLQNGLEHVGVVVGAFALDGHAEAFEAHAGVHVLGG